MKMMDEVAGIVAFRHCKTNVVTASIGKIKTKEQKLGPTLWLVLVVLQEIAGVNLIKLLHV